MVNDINIYCDCMEEIKRRSSLVSEITQKGATLGEEIFDYELACIQIRKILELIALSSLVSNKEIYSKTHKNFSSHWNAKIILQFVEELNPDFYPIAAHIEKQGKIGGNRAYHMGANIKKSPLSKLEFVKLYDICGSILHTRNPYSHKRGINIEIAVDSWMRKIGHLLSEHYIKLVDGSFWLIQMSVPPTNKVHAYTLVPKPN